MIEDLKEWAKLAGNHIFVRDLDRYLKLMKDPDFENMLKRRQESEGTNHTD